MDSTREVLSGQPKSDKETRPALPVFLEEPGSEPLRPLQWSERERRQADENFRELVEAALTGLRLAWERSRERSRD